MREIRKFTRQKLLARPRYRACTSDQQKHRGTDCDLNLIVVSHEATLTGAPKIILRLLAEYASLSNIQCRVLLHNGGKLVDDFRQHANVYILDTKRKLVPHVGRMVRTAIRSLDRSKPTVALVNSAESRHIAKILQDAGIPIVSLIHELPNSYVTEDFRLIESTSNRIVFPSQFVHNAAHQFIDIPEEKTLVIPQGLLDDQFGKRFDRDEARKSVTDELSIPRDANLVLGCGTIDLRKGIDHFVRAAQDLVHHHDDAKTHFVWLGGGPRHKHTPYHFVQMDVQRSGISDRMHFIGERSDVEPYFTAADAALMTSREDPFPCVVHEAMACGVPMITFAGAGGAPEALADGSGVVVPYGDSRLLASELSTLLNDRDHWNRISQRATNRVESVYNFRTYAEKIAELLELSVDAPLGYSTERSLSRAA